MEIIFNELYQNVNVNQENKYKKMINKKISNDGKNNIDAKMNTIRDELNEKKKQNIQNQESTGSRETEKNKKLSYNFTVAVRVKPKIGDTEKSTNQNLLSYSNINNQALILEYPSNKKQSYNYCSKNRKFTFDSIFIDKDNRAIYENLIKSKLDVLKQNMNLTLLTYGITGSGKTHTIFGNKDMKQSGLAMMVFEDVIRNYSLQSTSEFNPIKNKNKTQFMFSYMQIYNEQVHDLLKCQKNMMADNLQDKQSIAQLKLKSLSVFQDSNGKVMIPQLSKIKVHSIEMIQELVERGNAIRACSSNLINKLSSRSHAILQLYCIQQETKIENIVTIIDLAGSERHITTNLINGLIEKSKQKENQNLQKQGSNINRSLLALGNCLKGLQNGQTHIPYRDSKLTRILKEDLSGKSHNIMIACVGRNLSQADQTVNTLQYATRAVNIKVEKIRNTAKNVDLECMHCYKLIPWSRILQKLPQQFCVSRNIAKQSNKQINWEDCQRESEMKKMLKKTPQFLTPNLQTNLQPKISQVMPILKKDILQLINNLHCDKSIEPLFKSQDEDFYNQFRNQGRIKQMIKRGITQIMEKYQKLIEKYLVQFNREIQEKMKAFYERDQKINSLKNEFCTFQMYEKLQNENKLEEKQWSRCEKQNKMQMWNHQEQDRLLRESLSSNQLLESKEKRLKNKNIIRLNQNCDFVAEYRQYNKIGKKIYMKNKYEGFWKGSSASTMNSNNCVNSSYDDAMNNYRNRVKTQRMNPDIAEPDSQCNGSKSLIIKKLKEAKRDTHINQLERLHQNCSRIQLQNEVREDRSKIRYAKDSFLYRNKRQGITPNKNYKFSQVNNHKSNIDGLLKIRQCQEEEEIEVSSFWEDSNNSFHPQTFKQQGETFI